MALDTADEVYEEVVKPLPPEERLRLARKIMDELAPPQEDVPPARRRSWSEIRGIVPHPMCGEDAQAWITRSRREADEQREKQWSGDK